VELQDEERRELNRKRRASVYEISRIILGKVVKDKEITLKKLATISESSALKTQ